MLSLLERGKNTMNTSSGSEAQSAFKYTGLTAVCFAALLEGASELIHIKHIEQCMGHSNQ
jgi:hypothetical protein